MTEDALAARLNRIEEKLDLLTDRIFDVKNGAVTWKGIASISVAVSTMIAALFEIVHLGNWH